MSLSRTIGGINRFRRSDSILSWPSTCRSSQRYRCLGTSRDDSTTTSTSSSQNPSSSAAPNKSSNVKSFILCGVGLYIGLTVFKGIGKNSEKRKDMATEGSETQ